MAISLAHDVMAYFNDRSSAVYTSSLDAEGAFDAIPHVVIFGKLGWIVSEYAWRVLCAWYRQMYVMHKATRNTRTEAACQEGNPPGVSKQPIDLQRILRRSH